MSQPGYNAPDEASAEAWAEARAHYEAERYDVEREQALDDLAQERYERELGDLCEAERREEAERAHEELVAEEAAAISTSNLDPVIVVPRRVAYSNPEGRLLAEALSDNMRINRALARMRHTTEAEARLLSVDNDLLGRMLQVLVRGGTITVDS